MATRILILVLAGLLLISCGQALQTSQSQARADVTSRPAATAAPTQSAPTATPFRHPLPTMTIEMRYPNILKDGIKGSFTPDEPRTLDIGGRRFHGIDCQQLICYIELDDGAKVWISRTEGGY
jgi:hypothetical protein